ncbi:MULTISPECIES: TetR/AcrR family transcriptional regulator [unclassified Pseudomonas]|uniref:TetR/AcrR family transcriptional regulator n=1 Tax=unclassified Pseudomonas TaxID=196821 RepID=UPI00244C010E|nr:MULTISPECIES: TetR/AcrR family transcriptional regulator [unclassified Pseudomonas]MDH0893137.1 TetR/AcrR family transcriptional regulator [Pseudomonas sp. GD03875]MDH1063042.1 TetR/AcrR family transcriptional regulator [Pseudomonas sp. GD03985]
MSKTATPDAPLTRGHKKRERTRQGLIDAALRLFARKEVGEVALLEVASEAEVASGTIYNYFRTRDEVVEAVGIALADEFSEAIELLNAHVDSGARRLSIGVRMFIRRAMADPDWASAVIRVVHFDQAIRSKIAGHVRADLRAGAEEGVFTYPDEGIALDLVVSCSVGGMRAVIEGRGVESHDGKVVEMLLKALGATPARARKLAEQALPD